MNYEKRKCQKCGQELVQSGPFARIKREGESAYKGSVEINFWCNNESCEDFNKNIKVEES